MSHPFSNMDDDHLHQPEQPENENAPASKKRAGHHTSTLWELFTEDVDPQRQASSTCRHCHKSIVYHKKSDFRFKMLSKGTKTCIQYWLLDCLPYPTLREVAINVFSMATSSAASERGFSAMGFVHSKLRNRLAADKVQKLVFIKNNAPQLMSTHQVGIDWGDTDDNEEEEEDINEDECIIDN